MTDDELQAIEARAIAAAPGPWHLAITGGDDDRRANIEAGPVDIADDVADVDALFIAHGREDVPAFAVAYRQAIEVLRAIIYASDGCQGHRDCEHSMRPWGDARMILHEFDGDAEALEEQRRLMVTHPRYNVPGLVAEVRRLRTILRELYTAHMEDAELPESAFTWVLEQKDLGW